MLLQEDDRGGNFLTHNLKRDDLDCVHGDLLHHNGVIMVTTRIFLHHQPHHHHQQRGEEEGTPDPLHPSPAADDTNSPHPLTLDTRFFNTLLRVVVPPSNARQSRGVLRAASCARVWRFAAVLNRWVLQPQNQMRWSS